MAPGAPGGTRVISELAPAAASSAAAASSTRTTTSAAFGSAGAIRAPFVVVVAEEAAAADDAAEKAADDAKGKPSQAKPSPTSEASRMWEVPSRIYIRDGSNIRA